MHKENIGSVAPPPAHSGVRSDIRAHILAAIRGQYECDLEELVHACPAYTWNQLFLEVDRLSRNGELRLIAKRTGGYAVTLPLEPAELAV